jgi:uncharacterized membrane protein
MVDSHLRSIAKAVTWRAGGTLVTFLVALLVTRKWHLAAGVGFLDMVVKIGTFYVHERMWNRISFGKRKPSEYQI